MTDNGHYFYSVATNNFNEFQESESEHVNASLSIRCLIEFVSSEPYFGEGDRIGTTEWYCLFDGQADSAIIYGLNTGESYDIQVVEYVVANGLPAYFNTHGSANPG